MLHCTINSSRSAGRPRWAALPTRRTREALSAENEAPASKQAGVDDKTAAIRACCGCRMRSCARHLPPCPAGSRPLELPRTSAKTGRRSKGDRTRARRPGCHGGVALRIGVCKIDRATGLCSGCLRDLSEIGAWRNADDALRLRILERVARRRAARLGFVVALPVPPEER